MSSKSKRTQIPLSIPCGVCSAPAPEHFHFGGRCCYSCRAFFRRTVQRISKKGLKRCKTGLKDCEVSSGAKSCIHCRYQQCLKIGMVPELLQGRRRKSNIGNDGGNEEEEEEEDEGGSDNEDRNRESGMVEMEIKPEVPEIKMEFDAGQHIGSNREASGVPHLSSNISGYTGNDHGKDYGAVPKNLASRPSVIMFQRGSEQRPGDWREGEQAVMAPGSGGMTVSGLRSNTDEMMRMEHLMLREQGMALMRAGHMMNTQASIINSYMRDRSAAGFSSQRKTFEDSFGGGEGQGFIDSKESINTLMTETHENSQTNRRGVITEIGSAERKVKDEKTDNFMEPNIMEQINLLEKSPIYLSMGQFLDGYELGQDDVDNLLISTLEEVEKRNRNSNEPLDLKNYSRQNITHVKLEDGCDEKNSIGGTKSLISVLAGPYMSLTTEENNRINNLVGKTQQILKSCCPVSLYQARIGQFMGTMSMEDMLKIFTLSRKATNFMHYNKMQNVPFFKELTTRAQNQLITHNVQCCQALNSSFYFFGYDGDTAAEQEQQTNLDTGLIDFIRVNAPFAMSLPAAKYDEYYRAPWAASRELEARHKTLSSGIGKLIKEIGYVGYILLYSIQLFTASDKTLQEWNLNPRDFQVIKTAQKHLDTLYTRYLKEKVGWKRANESYHNQKWLMEQIHECMLIVTMENLQLEELSNSTYLDPLSEAPPGPSQIMYNI